jgi:hypothetical protein
LCLSFYPFFVASLVALKYNLKGKYNLQIILKILFVEFCIEIFPGTAMKFEQMNGNANEDISVASKAP